MSEVYTFQTNESEDKKFTMTVKAEFLQQCPNPEQYGNKILLTEKRVIQYFHNPTGPAVRRHKDGYSEFWLNGRKATPEEAARIEHTYKFNGKLMDIVSSDASASSDAANASANKT